MRSFWETLEERIARLDSILCVGLDPRLRREQEVDPRSALVAQTLALVERTEPYAAAFKPNIAFFEAWGLAGMEALQTVLEIIPEEIPVILDAKRGDIGSTAKAYARAAFDFWRVGAVTLSPYLGFESVEPFLDYPDRGVFVLARTSNPSAGEFQDLSVAGEPLYLHVARAAAAWSPRVGLVTAANDLTALEKLRKALPQTWFLAPGIGPQGGDPAAVGRLGSRPDGFGLIANASREIGESSDPRQTAAFLRDRLNQDRPRPARPVPGASLGDDLKRRIVQGLVRIGAFQVGDFVLKSGDRSPFYIDLRKACSDVELLSLIGEAYARLLSGLDYQRIAALPVAALPLGTAASLQTGKPLIYPRLPPKPHGAGRSVEGIWNEGDRVVMLDDLVSTGASKEEAARVLRAAGLIVDHLVVLIERGRKARYELESLGLRLRAFLTLEEFLPVLVEEGVITELMRESFLAFAEGRESGQPGT